MHQPSGQPRLLPAGGADECRRAAGPRSGSSVAATSAWDTPVDDVPPSRTGSTTLGPRGP